MVFIGDILLIRPVQCALVRCSAVGRGHLTLLLIHMQAHLEKEVWLNVRGALQKIGA